MARKDKILSIERKTVALGKVQHELLKELAELKTEKAKPAPPVRRNLRNARLISFEMFYTKRKIK